MSGVASAREDQPFLKDGQVVTVTIEGIGSCRNEFYAETQAPGAVLTHLKRSAQ
jgi:2-keto-4-pentenoate hydratase/2-oxohepta-3-ene-1,7-dioic acid hydratase in catechol pathway